MEFIKGSTNLDTRLEMPVRSYLPGDDSEGNIMIKINDGVYAYKEKTDGLLVSSFTNSGLWYSEDGGYNWVQSNVTTNNWVTSYINGIWYANSTANSPYLKYSYDGKTWENNPTGRYGNTQQPVIIGKGVRVSSIWGYGLAYSTDGLNWTQCNGFPSNGSLSSVVFDNDIFLACCTSDNENKGIWRSTDGINWTHVQTISRVQYASYAEGVWLAGCYQNSENGGILRSTDNGITWTKVVTWDRGISSFIYKNGIWFAAVEYGYTGVYKSIDNGATWSQPITSGNFSNLAYFNDYFLAIGGPTGSVGVYYNKSGNANSWTLVTLNNGTSNVTPMDFCIVDDHIIIFTAGGNFISYDGIHYTYIGSNTSNGRFRTAYQSGDWEKIVNFIGDHKGFIGEVKPSIGPQNDSWLLCDGSTYDTSKYPGLYAILGTNKLPDFREVIPVAIGTQGETHSLPTGHDVFTLGQIKERSVTNHTHSVTETAHTHSISITSHNHVPNKWNWGTGLAVDRDYGRYWFSREVTGNTNTSSVVSNSGSSNYSSTPNISTFGSGVFRVKSYGVNYYIRAKY